MSHIINSAELTGVVGIAGAWIWFWGYMWIERDFPFILFLALCYLPLVFIAGVVLL